MTNFGALLMGQPHSPDLNHFVIQFRPEGHQEPHNEVGSQSPTKYLMRFDSGAFQFLTHVLTH